jgi:hypothetical protein
MPDDFIAVNSEKLMNLLIVNKEARSIATGVISLIISGEK